MNLGYRLLSSKKESTIAIETEIFKLKFLNSTICYNDEISILRVLGTICLVMSMTKQIFQNFKLIETNVTQ